MKNYLFLLSSMVVLSCGTGRDSTYSLGEQDALKQGFTPVTVKDYSRLDGCAFLILTSDSLRMEPVNLADSLKKDGLNLWIRYVPVKDHMSICMAGKAVTITEARYRK